MGGGVDFFRSRAFISQLTPLYPLLICARLQFGLGILPTLVKSLHTHILFVLLESRDKEHRQEREVGEQHDDRKTE